jgi:hypothetical protein
MMKILLVRFLYPLIRAKGSLKVRRHYVRRLNGETDGLITDIRIPGMDGFVEYNGALTIHSSLLNVVLHD